MDTKSDTTAAEPLLSSSPTTADADTTSVTIDEPSGLLDGLLKTSPTHPLSKTGLGLNKMSPKDIYNTLWSRLQSWGSFIDTNRMKTPNSTVQWSRRLVRNIEHFQSNYLCVSLVLIVYCILTSPLLLLAIAAIAGLSYILTLKNAESPLKLFGHKFSLGQQYLFLMIVSFPLFYLAGAGQAVFWVIGASFFVIGLHASIYAIEMQDTIEPQFILFDKSLQNV